MSDYIGTSPAHYGMSRYSGTNPPRLGGKYPDEANGSGRG